MKWSWKLGTVAGIGVFMHWTFLLLLGWIAAGYWMAGQGWDGAARGIAFILAIFACILLHELGHALTARRFGCQTRDITLLPIGGVARLERIPEIPLQEFWVAIAGPAVNVVIAIILLGVLVALGQAYQFTGMTVAGGTFLAKLMWVNIVIVLFNLLPAFPMDGGRVLRALLSMRMTHVKATHIAAGVGQIMAIVFGILGIFGGNLILMFIALFVYLGAQGEAQAVEMRSLLKGYRVRDAMVRQFRTLSEHDFVSDAAQESSTSHQRDFPIMDGNRILGILLHRDLVQSLAHAQGAHEIAEVMRRDCLDVDGDEPLSSALDKMNACGCSTLLVTRQNDLVGILSEEHLGQWLMLHASVRARLSKTIPQAAGKNLNANLPVHTTPPYSATHADKRHLA